MTQSYQPCLYATEPTARATADMSWLRTIMLPFEALHRQQWSAPWNASRGSDRKAY
ncbi:hypothetical protein [Novosphingobium sp. JCM 18896]|uniref:hypothetical protein n=1 Tax=Novosphingobium sp. JCM 18896 TaxID=2989731 RepID=UPI0022227A9B|nr:hypothetical protein [Novosphingobium sp. JCM 18896]MCW1430106.1 hypothetical protein [Novosphingobium sp. JCM 18896]